MDAINKAADASVRLERKFRIFGRYKPWSVIVDGQEIAFLTNGSHSEWRLTEGTHEIFVREGTGYRSPTIKFVADANRYRRIDIELRADLKYIVWLVLVVYLIHRILLFSLGFRYFFWVVIPLALWELAGHLLFTNSLIQLRVVDETRPRGNSMLSDVAQQRKLVSETELRRKRITISLLGSISALGGLAFSIAPYLCMWFDIRRAPFAWAGSWNALILEVFLYGFLVPWLLGTSIWVVSLVSALAHDRRTAEGYGTLFLKFVACPLALTIGARLLTAALLHY